MYVEQPSVMERLELKHVLLDAHAQMRNDIHIGSIVVNVGDSFDDCCIFCVAIDVDSIGSIRVSRKYK